MLSFTSETISPHIYISFWLWKPKLVAMVRLLLLSKIAVGTAYYCYLAIFKGYAWNTLQWYKALLEITHIALKWQTGITLDLSHLNDDQSQRRLIFEHKIY